MQRLIAFNSVSLDGFMADQKGDMSWAHGDGDDSEWNDFVAGNAQGGGTLLFGRVTYDMMAGYWPTPQAAQRNPAVAEGMNRSQKVVFSRTLKNATWQNTSVVTGDIVAEVRRLKRQPGPGMAILGSASIVSQFAQEGLVDELQMVMCPVVIGRGKTMFETVSGRLAFRLKSCRAFRNGLVVLTYEPRG